MLPSVLIATDNIYKFTALFGLVVMISSAFALLYLVKVNYEFGVENINEYELLKVKGNLSQAESIRKDALEQILRLRTFGTKAFAYSLDFLFVAGALICFFGFYGWHKKVQPKQDELLDLQIEKMKREIQVLEKQLEKKDEEKLSTGI
jgi:hypothetical protein